MILSEWIFLFVAVFLRRTHSLHISEWYPIEAQVTSTAVTIPHPLQDKPARVEVQVKVQENGSDVIFPASGSAQRDDDSYNDYGGVVYFYNEDHVKVFVPHINRQTNQGVIIYSGGSSFSGPFPAYYVMGYVRVKVWSMCDLPQANFTSPGDVSISSSLNFKLVSHGLGTVPDLVVVQVVMSNGYISEAGGVTFNSERASSKQDICGTVFAFNDQDIRIWAMADYVACARDGWGSEEMAYGSGTLYIQAWLLDSCRKKFTRTFMMDKDNINTMCPTVDTVQFDSPYSMTSTTVSVQMKVFTPNNAGFVFYAGGSAMIDTSSDPYGAIIYGYTETEVFLWRPHKDTSNGYLVYVGGEWGKGESSQQASIVEVTVKVIDIDGSLCSGRDNCVSSWSNLTSLCTSTDCPIPDDIPNAHKLYTGLTNGSTAMYTCMVGYAASSYDSVIHCISGVWSSSDMNCNVMCKLPPDIPNAVVTVENNTARYFCNPGYYQLENTVDFLVCDGNEWKPTSFECIQICGHPPTIANAEVMTYNNKAMYSCMEGYRSMSGSYKINCTKSEWETTTFSCYALSCGPAPNITNADVLVNDDGAMYGCHYGFRPSNTNNKIVCEAGDWSLTDFQCLRGTVASRSSIRIFSRPGATDLQLYVYISEYATNSYDLVIHTASLEYGCQRTNCIVMCQLPPIIPNADVTVENNTARYFCNPGYYQLENTDDFISCDGNIWQPSSFECIQICKAPPTIANAEVMRYNNRAMYSCMEGYRSMSGSNKINCTKSEWQTTTFSCYALSCGPAPNITNADVLVSDDGALYACHYGHIPSNTNNKIVCEAGDWSLTNFQCLDGSGSVGGYFDNHTLERWIKQIKQDLLIDKRTTNAYLRTLSSVNDPRPASIAIGGSGVALLCFAILIIVLSDVLTFCKYVFGKDSKAIISKPC